MVCRRPTGKVNTIDEDYSSDNEESLDQDMHLLHVTYLEVNGVNDKSASSETDEWLESVKVGDKTLRCQLDTGAYASVLSASQLQELAPNAPIKPTTA